MKDDEIIRTCQNCIHYHAIMEDIEQYESDGYGYHFHNYCDIWKRDIPSDILFEKNGCRKGYDDVECGLSFCWAFSPKTKLKTAFPNMGDNEKQKM